MTNFSLLPVWVQAFFGVSIAFLATVVGAAAIFFLKGVENGKKATFDGFSAGIMLSAAFFSLLLPSLEFGEKKYGVWLVSGGFLCGCAMICLSAFFFRKKRKAENGESERLGGLRLLYASVTLHNLPEGLAIGVAFAGGTLPGIMLAVGIGIQNCPEGFCLAYPLRKYGCSRKKSFLLSVLSGAAEIPCAVLGAFLVPSGGGAAFALAFAAGAMVAVTAAELLTEAFKEKKVVALAAFSVGFVLIMLLDLLFA